MKWIWFVIDEMREWSWLWIAPFIEEFHSSNYGIKGYMFWPQFTTSLFSLSSIINLLFTKDSLINSNQLFYGWAGLFCGVAAEEEKESKQSEMEIDWINWNETLCAVEGPLAHNPQQPQINPTQSQNNSIKSIKINLIPLILFFGLIYWFVGEEIESIL